MMGKRLEVACFRTSVFPIIPVFPRFSRKKKNRATSPPESRTHLFSTCPGGRRLVKPEAELLFKCLSISYYNKNLPTFERIMCGVELA